MAIRLLDLFSGVGGCTRGYQHAGFHVTGVDHRPQPHYIGDAFIQADALEYCAAHGHEYAAVHASPPCQGYSKLRHLPWLKDKAYSLLLPATLTALRATGRPWVCENVAEAPLDGLMLCGQMFGLRVFRHRRFASSHLLMAPTHEPHQAVIGHGSGLNRATAPHSVGYLTVAGHGRWHIAEAKVAMGIAWPVTRAELAQAIPPAYTAWIGEQLRRIAMT